MSIYDLIVIPCLSLATSVAGVSTPATTQPQAMMPAVTLATATTATVQDQSAEDLNALQLQEVQNDDRFAPAEDPYIVENPTVEMNPPVYTPTGSLAFADHSDEDVFQKATDYLQNISTMSARFVQVAPSGNVSTGLLQMSRPGRLRFDYDDPNPTLIIASQGLVYVHDADLETTDSYPVRRTPLKFLLSRKLKTEDLILERIDRTESTIGLVLSSADAETEGKLTMVYDAPNLQLRSWIVQDPSGRETIVDLSDVQVGARIANNAYRVPDAGSSFTRDR